MGFPGGAKIARLADEYRKNTTDTNTFRTLFPRSFLEKDSLDFSLSGLKSAVKRYIDTVDSQNEQVRQQVAYAFEEAVLDVLVEKLFRAAQLHNVQSLVLAGGVSANNELRTRIETRAQKEGYIFIAPTKLIYTGDNAAMIGIRAYYESVYRKN